MKIIHVAGTSGSGKTTFIRELLPHLAELGTVASVKHLGHHLFDMAPGKDTTVFFETGIRYSAGIDAEKSVCVGRGGTLPGVLRELADAGVDYTVIEGFKSLPYPKVVFGDLRADRVILQNPIPGQVIDALDQFADLYTIEGLARELRKSCGSGGTGCMLTFEGAIREKEHGVEQSAPVSCDHRDKIIGAAVRDMERMEGVLGVRIRLQQGQVEEGEGHWLIAVCALRHDQAMHALGYGLDQLKNSI